jgi:hypothetical protein
MQQQLEGRASVFAQALMSLARLAESQVPAGHDVAGFAQADLHSSPDGVRLFLSTSFRGFPLRDASPLARRSVGPGKTIRFPVFRSL